MDSFLEVALFFREWVFGGVRKLVTCCLGLNHGFFFGGVSVFGFVTFDEICCCFGLDHGFDSGRVFVGFISGERLFGVFFGSELIF